MRAVPNFNLKQQIPSNFSSESFYEGLNSSTHQVRSTMMVVSTRELVGSLVGGHSAKGGRAMIGALNFGGVVRGTPSPSQTPVPPLSSKITENPLFLVFCLFSFVLHLLPDLCHDYCVCHNINFRFGCDWNSVAVISAQLDNVDGEGLFNEEGNNSIVCSILLATSSTCEKP
jgi:hypothetical protein